MQEGHFALMEAAREGKTAVVKELVKTGANLNLQNKVCLLSECSHVYEMFKPRYSQSNTIKTVQKKLMSCLRHVHVQDLPNIVYLYSCPLFGRWSEPTYIYNVVVSTGDLYMYESTVHIM